MAAGFVTLPIKLGDGSNGTGLFWSSDGTAAGQLQPVGYLGAGENHVGQVGGHTGLASDAVVVTAAAYVTGQCIGGKRTFANMARVAGGTGILQTVSMHCKSAQSFPCDLILFHTDPASSTFTDKTAFALHANDWDKVMEVVHISDWTQLNVASFARLYGIASAYKIASGSQTIYGVLVARGAVTFATTSDLKVNVKALLD